MKPILFNTIPADLATLSDDELATLQADHEAAAAKIKANDTEFLGELSAHEIVEQMKVGRDQTLAIKAELTSRADAQATFASTVAELASEMGLAAETDDDSETADEPSAEADKADKDDEAAKDDEAETPAADAPAETEVEVEHADKVVVAAVEAPRFARPPATPKRHTPKPQKHGAALVASAGIEKVAMGGDELDRSTLAKAMIEAMRRNSAVPGAANVVVASARYEYPDDRVLNPADGNEDGIITLDAPKIRAVASQEAMVASGGLCAPVSVSYELRNYAVLDRPVRDALPAYTAVRGGLRFAAAPSIADVTTAVGRITAAQDAAGGSTGTKTCQTVICPPFSEVDVAAIFACISAGNLGARAFPEQVAQFNDLVMAAHARAAETALLDGISAGSTAVTAAQVAGATSSLFPAIIAAAAGIRSHYRMATDATLRVLLPAWAKDLLKADIVRQPFDKYQLSDAEMIAIIRSFNVEPSFYMDGETGGGQVFATQNAGALNPFPTTVKWFIFPEGTWLYLDGGTLDLGIVRDSTLNATNSYQIFSENWENVAKVGVVSYEVTSTVADTGALSAPIAIGSPTAY